MENGAAHELAIRAGVPRHPLGFRDHRFGTAGFIALWGIAGLISTTAFGVVANPGQIFLYFLLLMAGVVLLFLTVAAQGPHQPVADRAAARLDDWIQALFYKEAGA